ncbi:hypothetical protein COCC4DRAFT_30812 [Bipolaris maydis ATCC 48331]|uniref:F-box domain-containing protein n=2 Tax=Cochliobolus heterostrophus TaxID=5016 RepID=M2U235_COCH5|nr:uncharacterized protein COCC4DRAFT_30812 [Bipolaris maydis ATCC 48331]EMD92624.1 hypothetical protein COCHEDRAFT_1021314 [Bipolaris maydis C5]KAJ5061127.1 hypothetical protein J3E74DRAFT_337845 [Bipolaris maydis]ENI08320.1 hypothetical protein COCC4DRAFT_30812 [Bipolaris maydis ATCC 48331]KAJ6210395.1 hypothetical protein PSV09DRAFT_1021314 [Bipolaris maydis]KAJ6272073.1 hypothetical protein PSV08DRAFT_287475 [Bipolaris maydis]
MQPALASRLMALPPELRCHIYSFLPELVYRYIWPVVKSSPVGVCSWPYYRLPTSLLLISKLIYQETKDASVQKQLYDLNERHLPVVVLGPADLLYQPRNGFMDELFGLLSRHNGNTSSVYNGSNTLAERTLKHICHEIKAWTNHALESRLGVNWEQVYQRLPKELGYSEENLDTFVACTLARMAHNNAKEARIRLVVCGSAFNDAWIWERRMMDYVIQYKMRALMNFRCDAESMRSSEAVTVVLPPQPHGSYVHNFLTRMQEENFGFKLEAPSIQDDRLFSKHVHYADHYGDERADKS